MLTILKKTMKNINKFFSIRKFILNLFTFINFFYLFSINKIKKRSYLYELREKLIFLIKIINSNSLFKRILFFPANNHLISFQKIFPCCSYYNEKKFETSDFGKTKTRPTFLKFLSKIIF